LKKEKKKIISTKKNYPVVLQIGSTLGKTSGIKNFLFESFVTKHLTQKPPQQLMEGLHKKLEPIHANIQKNLKQNQQLSSLRDWLLPMLMNGQLKVGEAAEKISMAAEPEMSYGG
jgi:type I restriction enzyme S subunit